jgi:hypothetical protein
MRIFSYFIAAAISGTGHLAADSASPSTTPVMVSESSGSADITENGGQVRPSLSEEIQEAKQQIVFVYKRAELINLRLHNLVEELLKSDYGVVDMDLPEGALSFLFGDFFSMQSQEPELSDFITRNTEFNIKRLPLDGIRMRSVAKRLHGDFIKTRDSLLAVYGQRLRELESQEHF